MVPWLFWLLSRLLVYSCALLPRTTSTTAPKPRGIQPVTTESKSGQDPAGPLSLEAAPASYAATATAVASISKSRSSGVRQIWCSKSHTAPSGPQGPPSSDLAVHGGGCSGCGGGALQSAGTHSMALCSGRTAGEMYQGTHRHHRSGVGAATCAPASAAIGPSVAETIVTVTPLQQWVLCQRLRLELVGCGLEAWALACLGLTWWPAAAFANTAQLAAYGYEVVVVLVRPLWLNSQVGWGCVYVYMCICASVSVCVSACV